MEGLEGLEEEETGFSYMCPPSPPPHNLLLHLLHPPPHCFFFFCSELFKTLCVLSLSCLQLWCLCVVSAVCLNITALLSSHNSRHEAIDSDKVYGLFTCRTLCVWEAWWIIPFMIWWICVHFGWSCLYWNCHKLLTHFFSGSLWLLGVRCRENEALTQMTHWVHTAHLAVRITSSDVLIHTALTTSPHPVSKITIQRLNCRITFLFLQVCVTAVCSWLTVLLL